MKPIIMKLTKSQLRSLQGQVKWIDDRVMSDGKMVTFICAHPTAMTFLERCGLLESRLHWIGTLNAEGRRVMVLSWLRHNE